MWMMGKNQIPYITFTKVKHSIDNYRLVLNEVFGIDRVGAKNISLELPLGKFETYVVLVEDVFKTVFFY